METMTDWEAPIPYSEENRHQAAIIGTRALWEALRGTRGAVSDRVRQIMAEANKAIARDPDNPQAVAQATDFLAHRHPDTGDKSAFMILPHGVGPMKPVKEIPTTGVTYGDVYPARSLYQDMPNIAETKIYGDPKTVIGNARAQSDPADFWKRAVFVNPSQLSSQFLSQGRNVLGHEITHVAGHYTDINDVLRGTTASSIRDAARGTKLPEQWGFAQTLKQPGNELLKPLASEVADIPRRLKNLGPNETRAMDKTMEALYNLRYPQSSFNAYESTFGEGAARYVGADPNRVPTKWAPWQDPEWDAPREFLPTVGQRIRSTMNPMRPSMLLPNDIERLIYLLRE